MISFPCLFPDPPYLPTHSIPWFLSLSLENKQKEKRIRLHEQANQDKTKEQKLMRNTYAHFTHTHMYKYNS